MSTRKPGRPAYAPSERDRAQVKALAAMGTPHYDIAKVMGLSEPTLRKYFWHELELGGIEANAKVAQSLFKMATDPTHAKAVVAAIFWLKTRAGWREADNIAADEGKKAQREEHARSAEQGTHWDGLLQ